MNNHVNALEVFRNLFQACTISLCSQNNASGLYLLNDKSHHELTFSVIKEPCPLKNYLYKNTIELVLKLQSYYQRWNIPNKFTL